MKLIIILSPGNTIPEFLLIMAGTIVIMSIVGVIIGTGYEKSKELIEKNKKNKIEIFSSREIKTVDDLLRFAFGSPGETSRVLTKNYFSLFFEDKLKTTDNLFALLEYRNNALISQGINLDNMVLKELASNFPKNIAYSIFAIVVYENSFVENDYFKDSNIGNIYRIVSEEYNKIALEKYAESTAFSKSTYLNIKNIFSKYDIIIN